MIYKLKKQTTIEDNVQDDDGFIIPYTLLISFFEEEGM